MLCYYHPSDGEIRMLNAYNALLFNHQIETNQTTETKQDKVDNSVKKYLRM